MRQSAYPRDNFAWHNRAIVHADRGDNAAQSRAYHGAIRLVGVRLPAHFIGDRAYLNSRDFDRAIADFDQSIKLDPDDYGFTTAAGPIRPGAIEIAPVSSEALSVQPNIVRYYIGREKAHEQGLPRQAAVRPGHRGF
jgi:tetratricopeptide (TPR) repeat protein